jgi:hypothetical protein
MHCQSCIAPCDVHRRDGPPCRFVGDNDLSGTLPKEWSTMTALRMM